MNAALIATDPPDTQVVDPPALPRTITSEPQTTRAKLFSVFDAVVAADAGDWSEHESRTPGVTAALRIWATANDLTLRTRFNVIEVRCGRVRLSVIGEVGAMGGAR